MYTLRDFTKTVEGLRNSLRKIREIGYPAVQFSAVGCMDGDNPEVSASDAKSMLDENGLKCIATHTGWDALANDTGAEIEFLGELDCTYTAIGGLPDPYRSGGEEGYRSFVRDSRPVLETLKQAGITFGVHNHAHEFVRIAPGPRTLYDILIDEGDDLLALEVDVFWAVHGGVNPERIFERCPGRVPVIHFKDKEVVPDDGPVMAPIGEGNLDWDHIIPACERAGVQWYAIEQDTCRRDPFDCLRSSFDFLSARGL
jgi:sugar phosphate isomerase/epimerase